MLVPKLVTTLRTYNREQFTADLSAGIVVGVVALPLAIAFAIASGVTPDRGLYTAIIAGFPISALGGKRVQIGGPTGAFVVIVFGIVQKYGIDGIMIESLLSAAVADGMIGGKHRTNMELVAQGTANIASPLFGGIPATGAIARTALARVHLEVSGG